MTYNRLEDTIKKIYMGIGVADVRQLDMELIASRLGFTVIYIRGVSKYIDSMKTICLQDSLSPEEQWQDFGHELCHALWHAGNQLSMPINWRMFQEWQARSFAYEACVPRFLLEEELARNKTINPILLIHEKFGVSLKYAANRYMIHSRKMSQEQRELFQSVALY